MMNDILWEWVMNVSGAILIVASILMFIVAVYPFNVLTVKSPMKIITDNVEQGDCVFVEMDYEQTIIGSSIVTVQVVTDDGVNIANQILGLNLDQGKNKIQVGFMLPRNINFPSDKEVIRAKLKLISRYEVYGFRNVDTHYCTEKFNIRAKSHAN